MDLTKDTENNNIIKDPKKIARMRQDVLKAIAANERSKKKKSKSPTSRKKVKAKQIFVDLEQDTKIDSDIKKIQSVVSAHGNHKEKNIVFKKSKNKKEKIKVKSDKKSKPKKVSSLSKKKVVNREQETKTEPLKDFHFDNLEKKKTGTLNSQRPKTLIKSCFYLLFILLLVFLLLTALVFFVPKSESKSAKSISKIIPFPAIIIGEKNISYDQYLNEIKSVEASLKHQKDKGIIRKVPSHQKVKEEVEKYFIRKEVVNILAKQNNVTVTSQDIEREINKIQQQSLSNEKLDQVLKSSFGWDRKNFIDKVIQPYLLSMKLSKKLFSNLIEQDELKQAWDKKVKETERKIKIYVLVK